MKFPEFREACKEIGLPHPKQEVHFAMEYGRRWRIDYVFERDGKKIAVEIEGGIFRKGGGRHNQAWGMVKDMQKYNCLTVLGYTLLRFTTYQAYQTPLWCANFINAALGGEIIKNIFKPIKK